jgi:methylase of polypeptide subunit release factors
MNSPYLHEIVELQRKAIEVARNRTRPYYVEVGPKRILCFPNVNPPHLDSKLLADAVTVNKTEVLLDAFSGSGIVTILVAPLAKSTIATDISEDAIRNIQANIREHKLEAKASAIQCDIFPISDVKFDVIALNPPYTDHFASTILQKAVWDENHSTLIRFFQQVHRYLNATGRIYISWANFADFDWLERLARDWSFSISIKSQAEEVIAEFMALGNTNSSAGQERIVYRIYELRVS